jgi:hypothetical protein
VTDTVRGYFYIGKHNGRIQQSYWGSGLRISSYIKKHGKQNLVYEILVIADEKYIFDLEKKYITDDFIKANSLCLNLDKGGVGGNLGGDPWNKGKKTPDEVKKKQSLAKLGKPSSRKGKKHSAESIAKIKLTKQQNKHIVSNETKLKLSIASRGRKYAILTCHHCGKTGGSTAMPRWHFENCKLKDQKCLAL